MPTGTVKWFNDGKGYGFITSDDGGPDLFVHYTGIADGGFRTLLEGSRVEFEVRPGRKGIEAFNVVVLGGSTQSGPRPEGQPGAAKMSVLSAGRRRAGRA